ncbi:MAG TPA: glycosyltransferase family 39 protein [Candidatus Acidoferrales bacterium]|nr:glycosyltransferase family 39 protein [Candidatus Acidoferrales bacterium]
MFLVLPVTAFVLFCRILNKESLDWRRSILGAAVFCGTSVVVITEALSAGQTLTPAAVAISWLAICGGEFLFLKFRTSPESRSERRAESSDESLDSATKWLLGGAGVITILIGITAVVAPPSMWDAMDYHLPRVVMWMSNHSVRFYPTPDYVQLIWGPWAEYAMMHTYLLWGSDRFVNMVQFFSMTGCLIGVSAIAKSLGASARGQALAVLVCVTIPEGVLEASGPMNTYVLAFWMTATVVFLLSWNEDPTWFNLICAGLSAGLAIFTKGTAYAFLPPIVLACWWMGSASTRIKYLKRAVPLLLLVVAINVPQFVRCYELTGSPLGVPLPDGGTRVHQTVDRINLTGTLANVLRNASLQMSTPSRRINSRIEQAFRWSIRAIGADPDDPEMIWLKGGPFRVNHSSLSEISASNPLHFFLLMIAIGLALRKRGGGTGHNELWYALGLIGAFFLFSALVQWQLWSSRHELPLFVLGAALTGLILDQRFPRWVGTAGGALLLVFALPFALTNHHRSLVRWSHGDDVYQPRSVLYFTDTHEALAPNFIAAADAVNKLDCANIAFDSYVAPSDAGHDARSFFVYPLMALTHADGLSRSVWYSGVNNLTSRYSEREKHPAPCAVICLDCANVPAKWDEYRNVGGRASVFDYVVVFGAAGQMPNEAPKMAAH